MPSRELPPAANVTSRRSLERERERGYAPRFYVFMYWVVGQVRRGVFDSRYIFCDNPCVSLVDGGTNVQTLEKSCL